MPCDSVQMNRIDMPKMSPDLAEPALRAAGVQDLRRRGANAWTFSFEGEDYTLSNGELTSYGASESELSRARNAIARGYSEQIIKLAAAKNNWNVKKTGERRFVAVKR